ncbi:hypothetical protein [Laspinema olomoucense]|uniref:hypothetical protein n=1 Tax=Laspinema olomoucense TaxID=3231600 RepID=UPI0021BA8C9D|nr:hypothetical protein [Laspinema sp. D3d]MCT7971234.1 hypothetical protein [Laspinema sp. D3d]
MGKWQKVAIILVPLVAIAFVIGLVLRPTRTELVQAPAAPDLNTDLWQVENIEDAETLLVRRASEQRRVKLCGITPTGTDSTQAVTELIGSSGEVAIAFLGKQPDKTWVGEVWVNPATEGEELLNGLLILAGVAEVNRSEWMSCPNHLALQDAEELAGLE